VVECRAVGLYHMVDEAGGDDKRGLLSTIQNRITSRNRRDADARQ